MGSEALSLSVEKERCDPLLFEVSFDEVRQTEAGLVEQQGAIFSHNRPIDLQDPNSRQFRLARLRECFHPNRVAAIVGVRRWLYGRTEELHTFIPREDSMAIYVLPPESEERPEQG